MCDLLPIRRNNEKRVCRVRIQSHVHSMLLLFFPVGITQRPYFSGHRGLQHGYGSLLCKLITIEGHIIPVLNLGLSESKRQEFLKEQQGVVGEFDLIDVSVTDTSHFLILPEQVNPSQAANHYVHKFRYMADGNCNPTMACNSVTSPSSDHSAWANAMSSRGRPPLSITGQPLVPAFLVQTRRGGGGGGGHCVGRRASALKVIAVKAPPGDALPRLA
ncbi:Ecto-NOX disulfide-thiol exchanger 2 [Liparis tanakae]|uniref:Ecto-NOX disulfide-thiol exchanger 2 n=1 Tax=Liparis tanakae TaxID=230148 RepID=A0A4Z2HGV2_9TELE|nr:Ecto-NOX disulfide-thiol exchanger 2 [Liparis tanakae]